MAGTKIALDMGTSDTKIYTAGGGIVLNEPTVVALDTAGGRVKAIGLEADDPVGDGLHKFMVMRGKQDIAFKLTQAIVQSGYRLQIQVIGRLI